MDTLLHKYASVPESFSDVTYERISYWLSRFVIKTRKGDGTFYPPLTLYNMVSAIQRYYVEHEERNDLAFLLKTNTIFSSFRHTLDGVM